ncbi:type II toxin-antitoxin system PemK/MazF family toxin [Candidatus Woesearchaeota archaeon]|nr:type II toxin-antitoxin system PemK/MazF family toxin [Candidatus Woesearchaeota archaeon]
MTSGTQFRQGDVILVPVPFTDLKEAKQRPALVISSDEHNRKVDDLVICGITSNIKDEEYSVMLEQKDMIDGEIHFLSRIKADKLFTIHKIIIKRKLGRVNRAILDKTKQEILQLIQ